MRRALGFRLRFLAAALPLGAIAIGCNAILNNDEGNLVDDAGTEPPPDLGDDDGSPGDDGGLPSLGDDGGQEPAACGADQRDCNGACVAVTDPAFGCGSAACAPCVVPNAIPACAGGACAVNTCNGGFADCNADPADGCETDLSRPETCGRCDVACPATAPRCTPGQAPGSFACTTGCTAQAPLLCDGACVDPKTDNDHCGRCGTACAAVDGGTAACVEGACTVTCAPGSHACRNTCALDTDPTACGATCTACPTPAHAAPACTQGVCTFTCAPGFADCDENPTNGCEVELATNPAHCGACRIACDGGGCVGGVCQAAPPPPGDDAGTTTPPLIVLPFL